MAGSRSLVEHRIHRGNVMGHHLVKHPQDIPAVSTRLSQNLGITLIILTWTTFWIPSLLNAVLRGRYYSSTAEASVHPIAALSHTLVQGLLILCIYFIAIETVRSRRQLKIGPTMLLILPWAAIYIPDFLIHDSIRWQAVVFPFIALAISQAEIPAERLYGLFARLTVFTAAFSIALGLAPGRPGLMPDIFSSFGEKALIGNSILAGPFGHSNQLGMNLALGLPFVALALRGTQRVVGILFALIAITWSASRTSLAVTLVVILVILGAVILKRPASRLMMLAGSAAATTLMFLLPTVTQDPTAFTNRGLVWDVSLTAANTSPFLGLASDAFTTLSQISIQIGAVVNTGHNVYVTIMTIGGWLGVAVFFVCLFILVTRASREYLKDPVPLLVLFTMLLFSIIEDPLRGLALAPTSWILIPILIHTSNIRPRRTQETSQVTLDHAHHSKSNRLVYE